MSFLAHPKYRSIKRYGFVLGAVGGALGLRLGLGPLVGQNVPLLMFVTAIMVSAWYGGFWPGMTATLLSVLCAAYFFLVPIYSLRIVQTSDIVAVVIFLVIGFLISSLSEALHLSRRRVEHMVQMRDQFLSLASHELKTPLTALLVHVELMQRRAEHDNRLNERHRRSLGVIESQSRRLARLVNALLDVSRLQYGNLELERTVVDVTMVVQRLMAEMQPTAPRHTFNVAVAAEPVYVEVDELRFEQVLFNLVQNAIKYSPNGGVVNVSVEQSEHEVQIRVRDEGVGIPAEALPHVFDRFFRVESEQINNAGGFGIGLSVVKDIVSLHGGRVQAESWEVGSTFTISLPRIPQESAIPKIG
jgi:signal transduction histidine kinase